MESVINVMESTKWPERLINGFVKQPHVVEVLVLICVANFIGCCLMAKMRQGVTGGVSS